MRMYGILSHPEPPLSGGSSKTSSWLTPSMALTVDDTKIYNPMATATVMTADTGFLKNPPTGLMAVYAVPSRTEKK